ncbi:hypothetical protein [Halochromatium roseum]|uniref:hypothetical protein n=1 Tax=Halochromatium roseum TaxID=391920 RepID=UPI0019133279|nr:hypothetical protein [Halochromatium roseum]
MNAAVASYNALIQPCCDTVKYDPPAVILERLARLEDDIAEGRREQESMLR